MRIAFQQSACAKVIDFGRRAVIDAVSGQLNAPAEINLFHVGEKLFVEATDFMENRSAHEHAGACCPKDLFNVIVLAVIFFELLKNAAAAERIAEVINESSCGTGKFE